MTENTAIAQEAKVGHQELPPKLEDLNLLADELEQKRVHTPFPFTSLEFTKLSEDQKQEFVNQHYSTVLSKIINEAGFLSAFTGTSLPEYLTRGQFQLNNFNGITAKYRKQLWGASGMYYLNTHHIESNGIEPKRTGILYTILWGGYLGQDVAVPIHEWIHSEQHKSIIKRLIIPPDDELIESQAWLTDQYHDDETPLEIAQKINSGYQHLDPEKTTSAVNSIATLLALGARFSEITALVSQTGNKWNQATKQYTKIEDYVSLLLEKRNLTQKDRENRVACYQVEKRISRLRSSTIARQIINQAILKTN